MTASSKTERAESKPSRKRSSPSKTTGNSVKTSEGVSVQFPTYKKVLVSQLVPYARNARTHSDEQISQIMASIVEFGWNNPILVDGQKGIIAGHGRVLAAQRLGIKTVPVVERSDMTEAQKRAYVIADNKLAENAGWDYELMALEVDDLSDLGFDIDLLGLSESDIDGMRDPDFDAGDEDDQGKLDELSPKMVACPHCGKSFDAREHGQD